MKSVSFGKRKIGQKLVFGKCSDVLFKIAHTVENIQFFISISFHFSKYDDEYIFLVIFHNTHLLGLYIYIHKSFGYIENYVKNFMVKYLLKINL